MTRFKLNTQYRFDYNKYATEMRQHGYQPDSSRKVLDGEVFTMQDTTNYVVLRKGHFWCTVNPDMCEEVK